jgi:hypothetical protein
MVNARDHVRDIRQCVARERVARSPLNRHSRVVQPCASHKGAGRPPTAPQLKAVFFRARRRPHV